MSLYRTVRNGEVLEIATPYAQFKEFKKNFNTIVSDGYNMVCQTMSPEITVVSKMRFEFDEAVGFNVVDTDVIGRLVYVHQEVVAQITGTTTASDLTCFVMTHPQAESDGIYYEEVFFQFPYIKASIVNMADRLLPNLKLFFEQTGIHEQMELVPVNDLDSILSRTLYEVGYWPLPGSYIDGNLLSINYVFDKISSEQLEDGQINCYPPEAYFSNFQIPDNCDYDTSNSFYFTNLDGFEMIKKKKTQREKTRDVTSRLIEERQKETKRTPGELCKIFIDMLSPERYAEENSRNKIGQVIFNILRGSEEGLELWVNSIEYKLVSLNNSFPDEHDAAAQLGVTVDQYLTARESMDEDKRQQLRMSAEHLSEVTETIKAASLEMWEFFEFTESTIGTLKFWAKMDSHDEYKAFIQKDVLSLAWKCLNATSSHTDVAKLVYAKYSDQFCCANIKDGVWFGFNNHRWHELDKCHALRCKLSDELPPIFERILNECTNEYKKAVNDEDKEKWSILEKACAKMIKELKTVQYKNNIVTEASERFFDQEFIQKLDEDRCLIGMPNGVYELETGTFRPGKPEDFITLSTKAKYNPNYSWEHPRVKEVVYYMKTVYPDIKLRHYVLKSFGSILEGGNMNKDFYNMVGEGDNSKSMIAKLIKLAMGKYISKLPVSMIMGKRGNADNATPHLADKKGIRALFVEEPPKGQSNVSVVKELSGNDDILSRALFKMPIIFSPQWKLFVWTNHMLEAPAEEKAYWNRQKVVDHESTFAFDAPTSVAEQFEKKIFPRDPFFDRKLLAMAEPFLWCMIEWHKIFKREGLVPPERVLHATNLAKLRNDIYLQYIRSSIEQGTHADLMSVTELYGNFRVWHAGSFNGKTCPAKTDFEDEMSKAGHLGSKPVEGHWVGIKIKGFVTQLQTTQAEGTHSGGLPRFITAN